MRSLTSRRRNGNASPLSAGLPVRTWNGAETVENSLVISQKATHRTTVRPRTSVPRRRAKQLQAGTPAGVCAAGVHGRFFPRPAKGPTDEWINRCLSMKWDGMRPRTGMTHCHGLLLGCASKTLSQWNTPCFWDKCRGNTDKGRDSTWPHSHEIRRTGNSYRRKLE